VAHGGRASTTSYRRARILASRRALADDEQVPVPVTAPPVKVLIVDDQPPFRAVARTVVGLTTGFEVVGEATSGEDAVALAADLAPDLVLMDINLPGINGIEATRRIITAEPDTTVLLLSTYRSEDLPGDARTCGAAGYVHKEDLGPATVRERWEHRDEPSWS
jgi:two-component system, NarL family, invasion response regulator UvrY